MMGSSHLTTCWVCKDVPMTRVDLDSTPITRTSPSITRKRRAMNKSRIWPRLFASSAKLKGTMLDIALWRRSVLVRSNKGRSLKFKLKFLKLRTSSSQEESSYSSSSRDFNQEERRKSMLLPMSWEGSCCFFMHKWYLIQPHYSWWCLFSSKG